MYFNHLNFYAKVPITGKSRLPGFRLRWTDTVEENKQKTAQKGIINKYSLGGGEKFWEEGK